MTSPAVMRLQALLESAELLHASLELDDLLRHLLRSVMGRLVVARAMVAVAEAGEMRVSLVRGLPGVDAGSAFDRPAAQAAGIEHFLPIGGSEPIGWLGVGRPPGGFNPEDEEFVRALLGIAASGIVNARAHAETRSLNQRLDQKVQELQTLLEFAEVVSTALDAEEIARLLGLTVAGQWALSRYSVAAWHPRHPDVVCGKGLTLPSSEVMRAEVGALGEPVDVARMAPGPLQASLAAQRAAVVLPLRSGTQAVGAAILGPRPGGAAFARADLDFAAGLAAQAVLALRNAWHVRETLERQRIEKELALAASIQRELFPAAMPAVAGFDIAARNRPARQVGGDYYDVLPFPGSESFLLCVADVAGKGLPAALLMSTMQATLRALLVRSSSPAELSGTANALLHATTPGNQYVTAILLALQPRDGVCRYANGGHTESVVLRCDGSVQLLPATGLPLGLFPGAAYDERVFSLEDGDLLACYSDGVTEANDARQEEFGSERLIACLRAHRHEPAAAIVEAVFDEVDRYAGDAPQYDDITLLILKRANGR